MKKLITFITIIICFSCSNLYFVPQVSDQSMDMLFVEAKKEIIKQFNSVKYKNFAEYKYDPKHKKGAAVRIILDGKDAGCIGFVRGVKSIGEAVKLSAVNSVFFDARYKRLSLKEINNSFIEITLIDEFIPMKDKDDFTLGKHSLYLTDYSHHAFLQGQISYEIKNSSKEKFRSLALSKSGIKFNDEKKWVKWYKASYKYQRKKFSEIKI